MSVLGVVLRTHPNNLDVLRQRLAHTPGVDLGPDNGDGRLIAVIESTDSTPAAVTMTDMARWNEVLNLSLVFEHAEPDASVEGFAEHDPGDTGGEHGFGVEEQGCAGGGQAGEPDHEQDGAGDAADILVIYEPRS